MMNKAVNPQVNDEQFFTEHNDLKLLTKTLSLLAVISIASANLSPVPRQYL